MNYEITYEDDNIVKIRLNDVYFSIEKATNALYELINTGIPTDVVIPCIFPSGHEIKYLSSTVVDNYFWEENMVKGIFNTITISENIIVGRDAFQSAKVKKVVWNNCSCIPSYCFQGSEVEEVVNIENVKKVMDFAFSGCAIKEMIWPKYCNTIPEGCFTDCKQFSELSAPNVKEIGGHAFACTNITVFNFPSGCNKIPEGCFKGCKQLSKVIAPCVKEIGDYAFAESSIKEMEWPEHCDTIPEGCFKDCKQLSNFLAPRVKKIEDYAFSGSSLAEFDWPTGCTRIPKWCFADSKLATINHIEGVTGIEKLAFANTKLRVLDLSGANINYLASKALARLPNECNLIPPYYYNRKDFENAIGL